jgi:hypothetical protein
LPFMNEREKSPALTFSFLLKKTGPYVLSGLFALAFLGYHYLQTGWIGYHADSPWAPGFQRVDFRGFLYNIGIMGWRLLDFGRVFVWLMGGFLLVWNWKKQKFTSTFWQLFLLLGVSLLVLSPSLLLHKGLVLHRYLLPVSLSLTLLVFHLLFGSAGLRPFLRTGLFALIFTGLLTGNLWVYPKQIAQGWDATLAHLPYYDLRDRMLGYIERSGIAYQQVGTAFPEIGPLKYRDLSGLEKGMIEKDLAIQEYIYYSNIMNDFTDAELEALEKEWQEIKRMEKGGVCIVLYHRPTIN